MAHILIVDDEPDLRQLLAEILSTMDHSSDQASDGQEGCRRVGEREYDLIITDIRMPGMTGLEFLRAIQSRVRGRTPCMIITAFGDEVAHAVEAIRVGACNFLSKPFELEAIREAVERALELRGAYRAQHSYKHFLEVRIREKEEELQQTFEGTLIAMASMIEGKDGASPLAQGEIRETYDHLFRVRDYSARVGEEMGLTPEQLHHLHLGSILHDIGKYKIPDRILFKPGSLDEAEWEVMRRHPRYGAEFVERIPFLAGASEVILNHHERWDGGGYPHGCREEEIPLTARIFSVVDAFDAICERRCYKGERPPEDAVAELRRCAGTQFDPAVVDAFERCYQDILQIQARSHEPGAVRTIWPRNGTPASAGDRSPRALHPDEVEVLRRVP